ncbi:FtsW/RodA/SpoVE family cell cycle protein [Cohnella fermenti]|nr:FtsW/RodA/SpoVE family cell cycle protein [Cohnella fermenti]
MIERRIREHKAVREYLDDVCGQVRAKELHEEIRLEIGGHLEELVFERLKPARSARNAESPASGAEGQSAEVCRNSGDALIDASFDEAIAYALKEMGDPRTIGKRLQRVHRPKLEWSLLSLAIVLIGIGLMAMYALQELAPSERMPDIPFLANKLLCVGMGTAALLIFYFVDYRKLRSYSWWTYGLAVVLFLLAQSHTLGRMVNGAYRWVYIGGFALDAASIAPYLFLFAYAGYLAGEKRPVGGIREKLRGYGKELLLFYALPAYFYLVSPSLVSLSVHLVGAALLLLTRDGGWKRLLLYMCSLLFVLFALREFRFGEMRHSIFYQRILAYLQRFAGDDSFIDGGTYARDFIRSAGFKGHGFDVGLDRLPYAYTENIVAYLVGALGWAFGIALVLLAAAFVYRSVRISRQSREPYARLLALAVGSILAVKLVWTLLMSVGVLPFVGIAMPFVGYSGLQTVCELASIGLLLGVYRRKDMLPRLVASGYPLASAPHSRNRDGA